MAKLILLTIQRDCFSVRPLVELAIAQALNTPEYY